MTVMRIRAAVTNVIVLLAPLHTVSEEGQARSMLLFDQFNLSVLFFLFDFLSHLSHPFIGDFIACARACC
jgi:hypothetical protein